ncbi:hypothetical protein [Micromonospora inyonensis]|uniref:Uncharacterized protein n=1 Tax=Micromonospora inyonensis TaxID=47866 RepID=A0A1C6RNJ5_9ACTN|nr:hypothetical protein [Micromonospora inyonensis]SCL18746.1 hypothetical protein GA0074694_2455 [Micromonospora inyonensis]
MREHEPTLADRIAVDLATVRWPEPAEIRARARRRARRQMVGAAVALVLVTVGVVAVLRPTDGVAPPPVAVPPLVVTPMVDPAVRGEIPPEVLLRPTDLREQSDLPLTASGLGESIRLDDRLAACRAAQGLPTRWETSLWSRSQAILRDRPDGYDHPPSDVLFTQDVHRVTPEVAGNFFRGLEGLVAPCATWRSVGPTDWQGRTVTGEAVHRWVLADRDFVGDEAALLRHSVSEPLDRATGEPLGGLPRQTSLAIVRVRDLVTVIMPGQSMSDDELTRLARVAATRLCRAANPPC